MTKNDLHYLKKPADAEELLRMREAAMRCLPEYRTAWDALVEEHGASSVGAALRELRGILPADQELTPVVEGLLDLSMVFFMERGPIDPDNLEDFGPWGGWRPPGAYRGLAIKALDWPPMEADPWIRIVVDASASKKLLQDEIGALREQARLKKTTRARGVRAFDDDKGWGLAFKLLRQKTASGHSGARIGREAFADKLDDDADRENQANKLIRDAETIVRQVRGELAELRSGLDSGGRHPTEDDHLRLLSDQGYARAWKRRIQALGPYFLR